MNQEKIGRFIAECRKEKNLTQQEVALELGVTDRSVSNWENGKNMPDLSLFKPLCEILGITINELLSGEKIEKEKYQEKFEENIVNTIEYTNKKIAKKNRLISEILLFFGLVLIFSAFSIFPSESSWGSIYSVIGVVISLLGFTMINRKHSFNVRLLLSLFYVVLIMGLLLVLDYSNVKLNKEAPRFRIMTTTIGDVIYYDTPFYDVYRCYEGEEKEYWVIKKNSKPTLKQLLNYCE